MNDSLLARAWVALAIAGASAAVRAQADPAPAPPAAQPPATPEPAPQEPASVVLTDPEALPGLDDLLGLGGEGNGNRPAGPAPPVDPARAALDRELAGQQAAEAFERAVAMMGEVADRLQVARDTGLSTQRLQEQIIRDLDVLIAQAEQNQQQQQGSAQSSSSDQQQQQQPTQQQGQSQQVGPGDNRNEAMPPGRREGALRPEENPELASWGTLPERVREALFQGAADRFSAVYRSMTEAYYKRLAEEAER